METQPLWVLVALTRYTKQANLTVRKGKSSTNRKTRRKQLTQLFSIRARAHTHAHTHTYFQLALGARWLGWSWAACCCCLVTVADPGQVHVRACVFADGVGLEQAGGQAIDIMSVLNSLNSIHQFLSITCYSCFTASRLHKNKPHLNRKSLTLSGKWDPPPPSLPPPPPTTSNPHACLVFIPPVYNTHTTRRGDEARACLQLITQNHYFPFILQQRAELPYRLSFNHVAESLHACTVLQK